MAQKTMPYSNPRFDDRIYSLTGLKATAAGTGVSTGDLQRGYMIQDKDYTTGQPQYAAQFLYNPSEVQVTHSADATSSGAILPQYFRSALDTAKPNVPLNSNVQFNLLYDRTYELWNSAARTLGSTFNYADEPNLIGVAADVAAIYRVVGVLTPKTSTVATTLPQSGSAGPTSVTVINSNGVPGPMNLIPISVYFGGSNSLNYRGYVSGLTVTYTHWSQLMVPMRCTINVTLTLMAPKNWSPS